MASKAFGFAVPPKVNVNIESKASKARPRNKMKHNAAQLNYTRPRNPNDKRQFSRY